ncbi:MAG: hypothetical protein IKR19_08455 [Acholeplasmatales bacterium]|nr:hypothetical protein [Acholeplasmatales bacterium]
MSFTIYKSTDEIVKTRLFKTIEEEPLIQTPLFKTIPEETIYPAMFTILDNKDIEKINENIKSPYIRQINPELYKDDNVFEESLHLNLFKMIYDNNGNFETYEDEPKAFYVDTGLDNIINANAMYDSFTQCNKGVNWKEANKRYKARSLSNNRKTALKIMNDDYKQSPPVEFTLNERGHIRYIKSHRIDDRVVQRSLNDNVLLPKILPHLISDNAASQKNKGLEYQRYHFEKHLMHAYNKWHDNAYILFIDFSKYFDNLAHDTLMNEFKKYLTPEETKFVQDRIDEFNIDVSYMSDEEFKNSLNAIFNSLEYSKIDRSKRSSGEKILEKSVGIGSQTSQIAGLLGPNEVDHYVKDVKGIKCYGRYMDDTYIILPSKQDLKDLFYNELVPLYEKLKIPVNFKKTQIHKITDNLVYLKINYRIDNHGILSKNAHQKSFHREYRRITRFKHLFDKNQMGLNSIIECYKSWRGSYLKYDSKGRIKRLDDYFLNTFNLQPEVLNPVTDDKRKENKKLKRENSYLNNYRIYLGLV